jgi:hypothetical protein
VGDPTEALNDAGTSPSPAPQSNPDDLVSTVDLSHAMDADTPPEGGAKPGEEPGAPAETTDAKEGAEKPGEGTPPDDSTRFDKHPRFIELNSRLKTAEETIRQFQAKPAAPANPDGEKPTELPYKDLTSMTDEQILDWQSEDPKGYVDNLNKMIAHQVQTGVATALQSKTEQDQQATIEAQVEKTYQAYATENPDFNSMWDSGEIKTYMDQNPGHNAISAHMAMTAETRHQKTIDDAVAQALKQAETARRSTRKAGSILGPGPSSVPTSAKTSSDELKNPSKYGGSTSVLAARLERMRAAR